MQVSGGGVYDGDPIPGTATVAGVDDSPASSLEGISPVLTYYAGSTATGTPIAGAPTTAGTYTVVASFAGSADYAGATAQATFAIAPATPAVAWSTPASIVYGTPLDSTQLDATADVPGAFSYTPAAGTILPIGHHTLSRRSPRPTPSITRRRRRRRRSSSRRTRPPSPGRPRLDRLRHAAGHEPARATASVPGTFAYTPASGTILGAGRQTLSVTFTPTDSTDYTSATATTTIVVSQATPSITWNAPSPIVYGTALGSSQLDADANVPGPVRLHSGRRLHPGAGVRTLSATFTPTDSVDYATATATTTGHRLPGRSGPRLERAGTDRLRHGGGLERSSTPPPACRGPSPTLPMPAPSWAAESTRCR